MATMTNAPAELDDILEHLDAALKRLGSTAAAYEIRRDYYDGVVKEVATSPMLERIISRSAQAHPIALAHIPVDVICDKIAVTSFTTASEAGSAYLDEVIAELDLLDEFDDWQRRAGYYGDYYAICDPVEEDAQGRTTRLRVVGCSPLSAVMIYDPEDERTPLYGVKVWRGNRGRWYANMFYDDVTVMLCTADHAGDNPAARSFRPAVDEDGTEGSERVAHLGGQPLLVHFPVDSLPYGTPLHRKAWGPQDAVTKLSATNLASIDGQAFPMRYALADLAAESDDDIDDDFGDDGLPTDEGSDGLTTATTGVSRVRADAGGIALLRGIKSVGQLAPADSTNALKNLDWYIRVMAVSTGTPLFEFDLNGEQPSGEARRRASGRVNRHATKVQRGFSRAYRTLADTILGLAGIADKVQVNFLPVEVETDSEGLALVALKIKNGVPVTVALGEAGYTPEQLEEWFPKGEYPVTNASLLDLADALAKLGNAATLGAITPDQIAMLLPDLLAVAREGATPDGERALTPREVQLRSDALGALVRTGAEQEDAAERVGLPGLRFPNMPTTVRVPEGVAAGLEDA